MDYTNTTEDQAQEPTKNGVLGKSISSGKWLTISYVLQKIVGLISFLFLARLLTPKDFGVIAIILIVPKFLQTATETGLSAAAIQKDGDIKKYLNPIWSIGLIKSIIIFIVTFLLGPMIAKFLHAEYLTTLIRLGGIVILIQNVFNVGEIYFFKDIEFKKIFIRDFTRETVYVITALIAVLFTRSYWVLIFATLAAQTTQTIMTYILNSYRPAFTLKWSVLKELINYSKWMVGQGWLGQIYGIAENFIITRYTGINDMGLYTKGKNLASVAPGFISSIMNNISFSAYAKIKESKDKINDGFIKSLHVLFFLIIPIGLALLFIAPKLILIFIGDQWLAMAATMKILFFYFTLNLVIDIIFAIFNGIGYPKKRVKFDIIKIPLTIILLFFLTTKYGITGASCALLIGSIPIFFLGIYHLKKITGILYRKITETFIIPFSLTIIILLPFIFWKDYILQLSTFMFLAYGVLFAILYLLGTYFLGKKLKLGPYETIKFILKYSKK